MDTTAHSPQVIVHHKPRIEGLMFFVASRVSEHDQEPRRADQQGQRRAGHQADPLEDSPIPCAHDVAERHRTGEHKAAEPFG